MDIQDLVFWLTRNQLAKLYFWSFFNKKRFKHFKQRLKDGTSIKFAFDDTIKKSRKEIKLFLKK